MTAHLSSKYSVGGDRVLVHGALWVARLADSVNFGFKWETLSQYVSKSYWGIYST